MQSIHRYNEKTSSISRIDFTILGNKEIKNISALGKNTPGLLKYEFYDNTEPQKGGLIDQRMGVTSSELECLTCGLAAKRNKCRGIQKTCGQAACVRILRSKSQKKDKFSFSSIA